MCIKRDTALLLLDIVAMCIIVIFCLSTTTSSSPGLSQPWIWKELPNIGVLHSVAEV